MDRPNSNQSYSARKAPAGQFQPPQNRLGWGLRATQFYSDLTGQLAQLEPAAGEHSFWSRGAVELAIFTEGTWQDFVDFSFEQPFFIKEFQDKPESSYICYDPMPGVKSHPQTPTLDVITLKFTVYNGL